MILAKLALVHSEISEAVEAVREGRVTFAYPADGSGKPEGMVVELADAVIRILDLCGALDLNLGHALERKHEYNRSRPHRHGGKLA
jgi:NTP pyrophosphatase (non-canonical NTP hydrolase)